MKRYFRAVCILLAGALSLPGGGSSVWESRTFADFVHGRFNGLSLTRDGRLRLAPKLDEILATGQDAIWTIAAGPDGSFYAGGGHRGRLYRVTPDGKSSVVWTSGEPEIFAVAVDPNGIVYAGTSPDGKVFRIENGKAAEYFNPGAKYIWALEIAANGSLYVATGDQGRVYKVGPDGKGVLWYETGQGHVTALALDTAGRLLAGTEPNGLLYRIEAQGKAFVLYDSSLPEIRGIITYPDGSIVVTALGGAVAQQNAQAASAAAAASPIPTVSTSITVTADSNAQAGIDIKPKPEAEKPPATAQETTTPATPSVIDMTGVEKSAIYRIAPDNSVETLWSSKEENIFSIAAYGDEISFSTDQRGRVYRLSAGLKASLLAETREGEATRLLQTPTGLVAATSHQGKLFRLSSTSAILSGTYESPVYDAGSVAHWGHIEWHSSGSGQVHFRTRSGNSARPDATWSEWSAPIGDPAKARVTSPNARYLQYQIEMSGPNSATGPSLDSVSITYLPQNNRPVVRSIQVTPQWTAAAGSKTATQTAQTSPAYSVTVTASGDAAAPAATGTPTQALSRAGMAQLLISWQADDPDGDKLIYSLWFRGEEESDWKLLKDQITDNTYTVEADSLADGRYLLRVEASDRLSNPASAARTADLISPPFLIDNTPPRVTLGTPRVAGGIVELEVRAEDAASALRRAEYSIDAGPWILLEALDGITDGRTEQFLVRATIRESGEHLLVVRVLDAAGNAGLAKTILK
jgi:sugar lactone lactonase YvrE